MHDDVHGTAVVSLAAAIVACREADRRLDHSVIGQIGLGAAGFGIASLIKEAGAERVIASDPGEEARERASSAAGSRRRIRSRRSCRSPTSSWRPPGVPGLIKPELVREGQVILALSNPDPEITIDDALDAGAAFAADGTVVNNVLGYPGMFRGALLAGATVDDDGDEARGGVGDRGADRRGRAARARRPRPEGALAVAEAVRRRRSTAAWGRGRRSRRPSRSRRRPERRGRCRWLTAARSAPSSRGGRGGRARPGAWPRALPCGASRGPSCRRRRGR